MLVRPWHVLCRVELKRSTYFAIGAFKGFYVHYPAKRKPSFFNVNKYVLLLYLWVRTNHRLRTNQSQFTVNGHVSARQSMPGYRVKSDWPSPISMPYEFRPRFLGFIVIQSCSKTTDSVEQFHPIKYCGFGSHQIPRNDSLTKLANRNHNNKSGIMCVCGSFRLLWWLNMAKLCYSNPQKDRI